MPCKLRKRKIIVFGIKIFRNLTILRCFSLKPQFRPPAGIVPPFSVTSKCTLMSTIHQTRLANRPHNFLGKLAGTAALIQMNTLPLTAAPRFLRKATLREWIWQTRMHNLRTISRGSTELFSMPRFQKEILTFAWPKVFLMTNASTGTNEKDCSVVVVLRSKAMPYALGDSLWSKYKLEERLKSMTRVPLRQPPGTRFGRPNRMTTKCRVSVPYRSASGTCKPAAYYFVSAT